MFLSALEAEVPQLADLREATQVARTQILENLVQDKHQILFVEMSEDIHSFSSLSAWISGKHKNLFVFFLLKLVYGRHYEMSRHTIFTVFGVSIFTIGSL